MRITWGVKFSTRTSVLATSDLTSSKPRASFEVDAEALLAAVGVKDEDVGAAFESLRSVTRWAPFVRQVRDPARPFHLDDLRSHIRQDTAAQRADDSVREVQDSNIIKNA